MKFFLLIWILGGDVAAEIPVRDQFDCELARYRSHQVTQLLPSSIRPTVFCVFQIM